MVTNSQFHCFIFSCSVRYRIPFTKMKKYAVAHLNFFDNDLRIKIVEALDWREALIKAFHVMEWVKGAYDWGLEDAKAQAFGQDVLFDVVEIT